MSGASEAAKRETNEEGASTSFQKWPNVVAKIRAGDPTGMEELYECFSTGIKFYLCRRLGPHELDDRVHDTFLVVIQAIRNGELREPERLMGYVHTVLKRQVASCIENAVHSRRDLTGLDLGGAILDVQQSPEQRVISSQEVQLMEQVLRSVSCRDREILTRFYLKEQTQEQICADMNLTVTQFRLLKSRAKARFGELGRRSLLQRRFRKLSLRKSAGSFH